MRVLFAVLIAAFAARAAVVQGVVLDDETGNPLARTLITLVPLPGTNAASLTIRSGDRGSFSILSVRPGWYVMRTTRRGYAPAEVGQMRPGRPGLPFEVTTEDRAQFFQIRMRHLAALTGSVLDENSVGIPDWPVHLYTARKPVRRLSEATTDERGNFRIGSLDAGSYVIRSGGGALEDESTLLPTYYKYGTALENAEPARLKLGETQPDVIIRPVKGRLFEISGVVSSSVAAKLTLITDTGRRQIASVPGAPGPTSVPFTASGVPPGTMELLTEGVECGGWTRVVVERDTTGMRVGCGPLYKPIIDWRANNARTTVQFPILMRRVDLDGTGPVRTLRPDEPIVPGHWELMVQTSAEYYVYGIRSYASSSPVTRDDGWFGLDFANMAPVQVMLSNKPASVSGVVSSGGKPVAGAAVYLELFNPDLTDPRLQLLTGRADGQGNYRFAGLAPGRYRVLSSFDFDPDDRFAMEKASVITLREADGATQALEMILP